MIDKVVERYIALRDARDALKKEHAEALRPYTEAMELIEQRLGSYMSQHGLESLPTPAGTAYTSVLSTASVKDRNAFMQHCSANNAWHLADMRASSVEVMAWAEAEGDLPPGIEVSRRLRVNVRRS